MKKILILLLLLIHTCFLFAEEEYLSSDGHYFYFFTDDFSEFKYTSLDEYGSFSDTVKISHKEENGITIWSIDNQDYVLLKAEQYFILLNTDKVFKFVKDYSEYWQNSEKVATYEASSSKRIGINHFDEFNLLYISFQPWISNSDNSGIDEYIIVDAQKTFSSFRIINGFVDIDNPKNFEQYNKVKELSVFDMNNNVLGKYKIENNSTIQSFSLPGNFTTVKFLITDIYDGTKYDDVAITTLQCY